LLPLYCRAAAKIRGNL